MDFPFPNMITNMISLFGLLTIADIVCNTTVVLGSGRVRAVARAKPEATVQWSGNKQPAREGP